MKHTAWHWPDHIIRKRESRRLREEHNALYNSHAELLEAITRITEKVKRANDIQHSGTKIPSEDWSELYQLTNEARAVIEKAKGES